MRDQDWRVSAACRVTDGNFTDSDQIFFPHPSDKHAQILAANICRNCTVAIECGTYMDTSDVTHGIWAGEYLNRPAKSYAQASRKPSIRVQAERKAARKANG